MQFTHTNINLGSMCVYTHTHTHTLPGRFFHPFIFYLNPSYIQRVDTRFSHPLNTLGIQIQRHICAHTFLHGHIHSVSRDDFPSSSDLWQYLGSSDTSAQGCFLSLHLLCKKPVSKEQEVLVTWGSSECFMPVSEQQKSEQEYPHSPTRLTPAGKQPWALIR